MKSNRFFSEYTLRTILEDKELDHSLRSLVCRDDTSKSLSLSERLEEKIKFRSMCFKFQNKVLAISKAKNSDELKKQFKSLNDTYEKIKERFNPTKKNKIKVLNQKEKLKFVKQLKHVKKIHHLVSNLYDCKALIFSEDEQSQDQKRECHLPPKSSMTKGK